MRITGGMYRGRTIQSSRKLNIRPATDRVRESIFSILPQYIEFDTTEVLDLYAGTGSLGFECLSRRAQFVTFVDCAREAVALIRRTAQSLGCEERCTIIQKPVDRYLREANRPVGLIFADPPYAMEGLPLLPERISLSGVAREASLLLIEHSKRTLFPEHDRYTLFRQKKFGDTVVSFFRIH